MILVVLPEDYLPLLCDRPGFSSRAPRSVDRFASLRLSIPSRSGAVGVSVESGPSGRPLPTHVELQEMAAPHVLTPSLRPSGRHLRPIWRRAPIARPTSIARGNRRPPGGHSATDRTPPSCANASSSRFPIVPSAARCPSRPPARRGGSPQPRRSLAVGLGGYVVQLRGASAVSKSSTPVPRSGRGSPSDRGPGCGKPRPARS